MSAMEIAFTKSINWRYEKEYRVVFQNTGKGIQQGDDGEYTNKNIFGISGCFVGYKKKISENDGWAKKIAIHKVEPSPQKYEMVLCKSKGEDEQKGQETK